MVGRPVDRTRRGPKLSPREERVRSLKEQIAGRDLVATTLSNPDEVIKSPPLRRAVLGRAPYFLDEWLMVKRITNGKLSGGDALIYSAAYPDTYDFPAPLDAWKLMICDVRFIEENCSLEDAYQAQLKEERFQTLSERARQAVRTEAEQIARRNAKWVIPILETLSSTELAQIADSYNDAAMTLWKQVSPAPPAWIQQIADVNQPWGFVFYKTSQVEREYGSKWTKTWEMIHDQLSYIHYSGQNERSAEYALLERIHCGGNRKTLRRLWTEDWANEPTAGGLVADNLVRKHFKSYRESLSSPGILQNTFIVVDAEPIPDSLDEFVTNAIPAFWVWAYDANWDPSLANRTESDGDQYEGRVKVSIYSLNAWFYAARYEGVSLEDMWLKAQKSPRKQWICYSKSMEEWDHESYI